MKRRLHASRRAGRFAVVITTIFACLTVTSSVWGWGAGHNDLQRAIIARLPPSFRKHLSEESIQISIRSWSHYPDSFETFDAESELIGPAGLAMLERYGVKRRYDLHHDRGRAVNFLLLVDSLRAKRYETALFWLSCLAHSTGDMAACNHDPLIHYAKYDWPHTGATVANGVAAGKFSAALDLSYAMEQPEGPAAFEAAIDSMTLVDNGHGPHEAILDVMMYGYEGAAICSTRGVPILTGAAAWLGHGDEEARGDLCRNMTELGAWAAVRATRDFEVAQRLALQDLQLELSDRTADAYNSRVEDWVQQSSLEDEVLYAPILNPLSASTNKAIGVVLEPTWRMNEGMLGFSDRVYAASICRTLAAADRSHVTLDIRDLARDGFPDPKQVSIVVIPATRFGNYHGMRAGDVDQHLQQYLDAGGRVVWIGGRHLPASVALAELRSAMTKTEKSNWPVAAERFVDCSLHLVDGDSPKKWQAVRSPDTPSGWHMPYCPWQFSPLKGTSLVPLLKLVDGDVEHNVGVLWRHNDQPTAAFLPVYALSPHLFTQPRDLAKPDEPSLDETGSAILLDTLHRLSE